MTPYTLRFSIVFVLIIATVIKGDVIEYDEDFEGWTSAIGEFTFVGFTGFEDGEILTDQLSNLGIEFTDGDDIITQNDGFVDDWGLRDFDSGLPEPDNIIIAFDEPVYAIGVDFQTSIQFELFYRGESTYVSNDFLVFGQGTEFTGLVSDEPFDELRIWDPSGGTYIDNFYFGPPIPAPGALTLFAVAALSARLRRRRTG